MTVEPAGETSLLELLWLEAVSLIEDQHLALVERADDQQSELERSAILKQLGQDLISCAAAAELVIRRRSDQK